MTATPAQVAAAMEALDLHGVLPDGPARARVMCACRSHWMTPVQHRKHVATSVADAVVAAGPDPAEALRETVARVEVLARRWETVPALRRGTCAADLRAALAATGPAVSDGEGATSEAHECSTCADCIHNGKRCCGCYDGACCQTEPWRTSAGEVAR